ncbi:MAG: phosphatase PAP2 family protein [Enterobacteriaceae bacterium]
MTNIISKIDYYVINYLDILYLSNSTSYFNKIGLFLSLNSILITMSLIAIIIAINFKNKDIIKIIKFLLSNIFISIAINFVIRKLLYRPRPFVYFSNTYDDIISHKKNSSFPSNHASAMCSIYISLSKNNKIKHKSIILFLSFFIIFFRIYFKLHFFSDILGSFFVSFISYFICSKLFYE